MIRLICTLAIATLLVLVAMPRGIARATDDASAAPVHPAPPSPHSNPGNPAAKPHRITLQPNTHPTPPGANEPDSAALDSVRESQHPAKLGDIGADAGKPPPPGDPPRPRRDGRQRMSPEMIDRLLALARTIDPARAERLAEMRRDNLPAFQRWFATNGRRLAGLLELERKDPELFSARVCELRAEAKVNNIARQYHKAREDGQLDEASRLEAEVRAAEDSRFDCYLRARGMELAILANKVEKMKQDLQDDLQNRDKIIEDRITTLLTAPPDDDVPVPQEGDDMPAPTRHEPSSLRDP